MVRLADSWLPSVRPGTADPNLVWTTWTHNELGQLTAVDEPAVPDPANGNTPTVPVTSYVYDAYGNEVMQVDADQHAAFAAWEAANPGLPAIDYSGSATRFYYDALGRPTGRKLPDVPGQPTTPNAITYDAAGREATETDFKGQVTQFVYDNDPSVPVAVPTNLGLPDALTENGFQSTVVYYDPDTNELREPTMGGGLPFNPATYNWKFRARQVDGSSYEFDSSTGQLLDYTDRLGNTINYSNGGDTLEAKDNTGKLLSTVQISRTNGRIDTIDAIWNDGTNTLTKTLKYDYDSTTGDLAKFTDFNNAVTQYTYNRLYQHVVATSDGDADDSTGYDTDNDGDGTWVDAGSLNRPHFLTRITDANGNPTLTVTFDANGRLSGLVDASGASAGISYTLDDNSVTLPSGQTPQITVDALGNKSGIIRDANGNIVRQFQQTGANTYLVTVYQYDANNNQTAASKPHEVTGSARYTWQPAAGDWATQSQFGDPNNPGLPTVETDANGKTTKYTYDGHGNVTTMVDPLGQTTTNVYDSSTGELKQSSDGSGATSSYTYDSRGNLQLVQQSDDNGNLVSVVTPHVNDLDLMDSFTNAAGETVSVGYDTRGRQKSTQYVGPDGKIIRDETDYDDDGRIIATRHYINYVDSSSAPTSSSGMSYDASGKLLTSTDAFGRVSSTRYDIRGDIVESRTPAKDENGNAVTLVVRKAYDLDGREIAQTEPFIEGVTPNANLRVTHTIYDAAGRVIETRRLAGVSIDLTYVSGGTGTDHLGGIFRSTFSYDATANTYGGVPAANVVLSSEKTHYDNLGHVDYTTSDTGLVTNFAYDADGNQTKTWYDIDLHGDGNTEHVETDTLYDDAGQQIRVTDPVGRVTDYKYDDAGHVTDTIQYGVVATNITPGGTGDNTADDMVTQTRYDDQGRQVATIDALGRETDYQYDNAGRLIAVTLPPVGNGDARRPRYEYHYDTFGHQTFVISNIYLDPTTNQVVYVTKDAGSNATLTTRAASDTPDTWPTNKGDATAYTYDGQGRQIKRTLPNGEFEQTVYFDTSAGVASAEVKYAVDFTGRVTAYDYDNSATGGGRVTAVRYYNTYADYLADTGGTNAVRKVSTTYDAFGRVLVVTDSAFATPTTYTYDADGHVTKIDSAQGTVHYAYDNFGRKTDTWTGAGDTLAAASTSATTMTHYGYDPLNRPTSTTAVRRFGQNVSGAQSDVTTTVFAVDGQIDYETATTAGGIVTTDYSYDAQGRPTAVNHFVDNNGNHVFDSGDTLLSGTTDAYNNDNTRKSETATDAQGNVTNESWTYDGDGHVASETFDGTDDQGHALDYTDSFTYDMAGNRSTLTHADRTPGGPGSAGASYVITDSYDGDDRLINEAKDVGGTSDTADDTYTVYGYTGTDQATQTVHQGLTSAGTITQTTTYTYDATGHMTGVSITDNTTSTTTSVAYAYDANGVRVERTANGVRTIYLVDPDNATGYTQVLEEGADTNNNHRLDAAEVQQAFTIGMRVLTQATATQALKLLSDAHGSTRAVLDAGASTLNAAAVLQHYVYSAFGSDLGLPSTPLTDLRYAGQMIDPLTGLSYNRARWYDPATGRFTQFDSYAGDQQDPITLNKYLYGNGNPIDFGDPSGNMGLADLLVTIGGEEVVEKAMTTYRAGKATETVAKNLVRIALVAMEAATWEVPQLDSKHGFIEAYYLYLWAMFERNYNTEVAKAKLVTKVPTIAKYIAGLPKGVEALEDGGGINLGPLSRGFLSNLVKGTPRYVVFIPYTGRRSWDFALSYAMAFANIAISTAELDATAGMNWVSTVMSVAKGALPKGLKSGLIRGFTWHHNELVGVMELVNAQSHADNGHTGGVAFYKILMNTTKYG